MAWTASLPSVVTGNPTKASDYNNLLNNLLFRRDTVTGDTTQVVVAVGSDGSAAAPAIKRNADATGLYFAAGAVNVSCAGTQLLNISSIGAVGYMAGAGGAAFQGLINGAAAVNNLGNTAFYAAGAAVSGLTYYYFYAAPLTIASGGTTINVLYAGAQSAGNGTIYGVNFGNLTSTGAFAYGISIGNIASGGGSNAYGIALGTIAGGASSGTGYGIYMGAVTGQAGAYSFYSAGAAAMLFNGFAIRIGGGDAGGLASTLTITSATGAITPTNAYAVKGTAAAGTTQALWLKIYSGTTAYFIPVWTTI